MKTKEFRFELGATARDVITGFEGVVTGRCDYITGCTQFLLQPRGTAKKPSASDDSRWVDEARLESVGRGLVRLAPAPNGGPQAKEPPRR